MTTADFRLQRSVSRPASSRLSWRSARTRAWGYQIAAVAAVAVVVALVASQTAINLRQRHIASGFAYLDRTAGFEIASSPIRFSSSDTYARALAVGVLNTLRVTGLGIVLASVLGAIVGVARLSPIGVARAAAGAYVEVLRNTPLLLQLLFWYSLFQLLPDQSHAWNPAAGVFLCDRGLYLPAMTWSAGTLHFQTPTLAGFGFRGGTSVTPEFAALLIGLTTYTAALIGEILRGAIQAVDRGQKEAAAALGLSRHRTLRSVVLPQALPAIVPPLTTQYLNLAKNSSLAVAIGYPDLIATTTSTLNQTGQAVEAIAVAMACYLALSLVIALPMGMLNRTVVAAARPGNT
jgi:general L-amino acid transport system permease protein